MPSKYADIAFTDAVRSEQASRGSRDAYARRDAPANDRLTEVEQDFIQARDSFYMATVSSSGWPYLQHRGGPQGFVKVIDDKTLAFADFRGNRQYITTGNIATSSKTALFFMDYPNRRRLKVFANARVIDDPIDLVVADYRARIERGLLFDIVAFDWNCPQHITPRWTEEELASLAPGSE